MAGSLFQLTIKPGPVRFDQLKIRRAADRAKIRNLKRAGAIVRAIARRSIKFRKKKNSQPGDPPFAHVSGSQFGLRWIEFAYDPSTESVIVGPLGKNRDNQATPGILEDGGRSRIRLPKSLRRKLGRETIVTSIKARPFMGPAVATFAEKYPEIWEDSIK